MTEPIRVGDVVHGNVAGWFGRDHHNCARVEAVGADWAIIRTIDQGIPCAGTGVGILQELADARNPKVTEYHTFGCPENPPP